MLKEFIYHVKYESSISFRGWGIWTLFLSGFIMLWIITLSMPSLSDWGDNINYSLGIFSFPYAILAILQGVHISRRDTSLQISYIWGSLPYHSFPRNVAILCIHMIPYIVLILYSILQWLWICVFVLHDIQAFSYPALMFLSLTVGYAYALTIGWVLGQAIKGKWSYLIAIGVFLFHIYATLLFVGKIPEYIKQLLNFMLLDYKIMGFYDSLWGFANRQGFWYHRLVYVSIIFFLITLTLTRISKSRKEPLNLRNIIIIKTLIVISLAFFLFGFFEGIYREKQSFLAISNITQEVEVHGSPKWKVTDYTIDVDYIGTNHLEFETEIKVFNPTNQSVRQMEFTLRETLSINGVHIKTINADYERKANSLIIKLNKELLPQHEETIYISYGGIIEESRKIEYNGEFYYPLYSANTQKLFLPAAYAWYPLPGIQRIHSTVREGQPDEVIQDIFQNTGNSNFNLVLSYPDQLEIISNLNMQSSSKESNRQILHFSSTNVEGVSLLGGTFNSFVYSVDGMKGTAYISRLKSKPEPFLKKTLEESSYYEISKLLGLKEIPQVMLYVEVDNKMEELLSTNIGGVLVGSNLETTIEKFKREKLFSVDTSNFMMVLFSAVIQSYFQMQSDSSALKIELVRKSFRPFVSILQQIPEEKHIDYIQTLHQWIVDNPNINSTELLEKAEGEFR